MTIPKRKRLVITSLVIGLIALILVFNFSRSKYHYEDILYNCAETNLSIQNRNLNQAIDSVEQFLIKDGILKSTSAVAYKELIDSMANPEAYFPMGIATEYAQLNLLSDLFWDILPCSNESAIDTAGFARSKLGKYLEHINLHASEISQEDYFSEMNEMLTLEDLSHPLYKLLTLFQFANSHVFPAHHSCAGSALWMNCHNCSDDTTLASIEYQDTISFKMDSYIKTTINGIEAHYLSIPETVSHLLLTNYANSSEKDSIDLIGQTKICKTLIEIEYLSGTSLNSMYDLERWIAEGFDIARDSISQNVFNTPYLELDNKHENAINEILPVFYIRK